MRGQARQACQGEDRVTGSGLGSETLLLHYITRFHSKWVTR